MKGNSRKYGIYLWVIINTFISLSAFPRAEGDTIGVVSNAHNILITKSEEKTKIYAEYIGDDGKESFFYYAIDHLIKKDECDDSGINWALSVPYHTWKEKEDPQCKSKLTRYLLFGDHIYAGWRFNYHEKSGIKNCFEIGIRNIIGIGWRKGSRGPLLSLGLGVGFNTFNSESGYIYTKDKDKLIVSRSLSEWETTRSRLDIYKIQLPLILRQTVNPYISFSIGASLNMNVYASASTVSKNNSSSEEKLYKGLQQRFITTDIFASLNIFGLGFYVSWNPIGAFKPIFGPEIRGWSIGIDLISL